MQGAEGYPLEQSTRTSEGKVYGDVGYSEAVHIHRITFQCPDQGSDNTGCAEKIARYSGFTVALRRDSTSFIEDIYSKRRRTFDRCILAMQIRRSDGMRDRA